MIPVAFFVTDSLNNICKKGREDVFLFKFDGTQLVNTLKQSKTQFILKVLFYFVLYPHLYARVIYMCTFY